MSLRSSRASEGTRQGVEAISSIDPFQTEFWNQIQYCLLDICEGPNRLMQWGVPGGTRNQKSGELVYDDLVISAALCSVLIDCEWGRAESSVIEATDPLDEMDDVFY